MGKTNKTVLRRPEDSISPRSLAPDCCLLSYLFCLAVYVFKLCALGDLPKLHVITMLQSTIRTDNYLYTHKWIYASKQILVSQPSTNKEVPGQYSLIQFPEWPIKQTTEERGQHMYKDRSATHNDVISDTCSWVLGVFKSAKSGFKWCIRIQIVETRASAPYDWFIKQIRGAR